MYSLKVIILVGKTIDSKPEITNTLLLREICNIIDNKCFALNSFLRHDKVVVVVVVGDGERKKRGV